jgi:Cu2+-exporting ATPase
VHRLLNEGGLQQYYQLKPQRIQPLLNYFDRRPSLDWVAQQAGLADGRLELAVEGIQCGACVWAIEKVATRHGGARVGVNSALGRLSLRFEPGLFQPQAYIATLTELGYRVRPLDAGLEDRSQGVLLRLGVCGAAAMNAMLLSLPFYLGLQREDGSGFYTLLRGLSFGLTLFSVLFGGSYFLARAWRNLRQGVAHFDLTIALGIATAFIGSTWAWAHDQGNTIYFDSVNVFITFMLAGRFLQERALLANRRSLLKGDAFEHAQVTLLAAEGPREIAFPKAQAGDRLLLQPGSLCPAEAVLEPGQAAEFDRAAITGELRPAALQGGEAVAAGARLVSGTAVRVRCSAPFSAGLLARLASSGGGDEELPVLWRWAVRWYVGLVLLAATGGALYWMHQDAAKAAQVFIATLVVTCPCGLGIAIPLARTLADRRLALSGLTVRQPGLLERLQGVRRVCLDKTGTLTFSHLELADPAALQRLSPPARRALMGAASASRHPISRSLFRELAALGEPFPEDGKAVEVPGQGVHWTDPEGQWFLGRSMDAGPEGVPGRAVLSLNGAGVAAFDLHERLLEDATASLQALQAQGIAVEVLSGDEPSRVQALCRQLGLGPRAARGGCGPDAKAAAVAEQPTLMLGDGLNDGLALAAATVSGTPTWERTMVADHADFSFASASLSWLPAIFQTSRDLRRALWGNLAFAGAYNLALLSFAVRGAFSPLFCAVTMPASSLLVIAVTARSMRAR